MQLKPIRQDTAGSFVSLLAGADSQAVMLKNATPGVRGFMKRYSWRALNPTLGTYDFTELLSDLAFCDAHGLKLVAMILDKSFSPGHILPDYLLQYEIPNVTNGVTAKRWDPAIVTAFNALTAAMGIQLNAFAAFEGVAFVESSISLDTAVAKKYGYTPELYRDALIATLLSAARAMPNSCVHWFMNFLQGNPAYLGQIATALLGSGVQMGGPDILPDSPSLVNGPYLLYPAFAGQLRLFGQMSNPGYAQAKPGGGYYSVAEMFNYAKTALHVSKIFWMPSAGAGFKWSPDAQTYIAVNPIINP